MLSRVRVILMLPLTACSGDGSTDADTAAAQLETGRAWDELHA